MALYSAKQARWSIRFNLINPETGNRIGMDEQRDINDARPVFVDAADMAIDREMVQLAKELIERQTSRYDPSDLEDRYETRLRAMIMPNWRGRELNQGAAAEPDRSNVIDLNGCPENTSCNLFVLAWVGSNYTSVVAMQNLTGVSSSIPKGLL